VGDKRAAPTCSEPSRNAHLPSERTTATVFVAALCFASLIISGRAEAAPIEGIHKIQHVVMIMQENRSFDSYFGTYPGARGIPVGVCVPDPLNGGCVKPFHDAQDKNVGGPHGTQTVINDIDGGKMDGFVGQAEQGLDCSSTNPECSACNSSEAEAGPCEDVMGYHDAREIPNYWTYAQNYVLQDNMFQSAASWSLPEHLYMVSGWSAVCPHEDNEPFDCANSLDPVHPGIGWNSPIQPGKATYAWTDITYLLAKANVSWRYYIYEGAEPDCESDEALTCKPVAQGPKTPGIWNTLPDFTTVKQDKQLEDIQSLTNFFQAAKDQSSCKLPNVAWIDPNIDVSEHPPSRVSRGQAYVTTLVNTIMRSPCWSSTAVFLSWDDWGGFYDHVVPPVTDQNGYSLRVPGLVISPYARAGFIDHQQLSHDSYLKFIEDDFLLRQRLNPATDGRPDKRSDVREEAPGLGDLANDFNFEQAPRAPLLLPAHPEPGPGSEPPGGVPNPPSVVSGVATSLARTTAVLNATVNPSEGKVTNCHFDYGSSTAYGSKVPCTSLPGSGGSPVAVSAPIGSLSPHADYFFRIVASNVSGTSNGAPQSFTTTSAEGLPQLGRCAKLSGLPTGKYATSSCTTKSPSEDTGPYEWNPGPSAQASIKGTSDTGGFGPLGAWRVNCTSGTYQGVVSGARTERATIVLKGCKSAGLQASCQNTGAAAGRISTYPLDGELGYIKRSGTPLVGLLFRPTALTAPALTKYECGGAGSGSGAQISEIGSVIASTPIDKMSRELTVTFSASEGHQIPEAFEGGAKQLLTSIIHPSKSVTIKERSSWSTAFASIFEAPLEIKAI
jgi:phospholipase C